MPLPAPRTNEPMSTFVARFMRETANDKTLNRQQRLAIAHETWRKWKRESIRAQ